jgi:hypothetical protein
MATKQPGTLTTRTSFFMLDSPNNPYLGEGIIAPYEDYRIFSALCPVLRNSALCRPSVHDFPHHLFVQNSLSSCEKLFLLLAVQRQRSKIMRLQGLQRIMPCNLPGYKSPITIGQRRCSAISFSDLELMASGFGATSLFYGFISRHYREGITPSTRLNGFFLVNSTSVRLSHSETAIAIGKSLCISVHSNKEERN